MRKILFSVIVLGTLLWSCGGSGGDKPTPDPDPDPTPVNEAPTTPSLIYPSQNLKCIENSIEFKWNASTDPNGDAITYQVQIAKDNAFTNIVETVSHTGTSRTISLDKGVAYYWRVSAKDSKNKSSDNSSVNSFYTEGIGVSNYIPFSPSIISPELNDVVTTTSATLEWEASDVDNDPLTYFVYLSANKTDIEEIHKWRNIEEGDPIPSPPSELLTEVNGLDSTHSTNTLTTPNLTSATDYYWKVVANDGKGGEAIGQIWSFKTD